MNSSVKAITLPLGEDEGEIELLENIWPRVKEFIAQELTDNLNNGESILINNSFAYKISPDGELSVIDKELLEEGILGRIDNIGADTVQQQVYDCMKGLIAEAGIIKKSCGVDYLEKTSIGGETTCTVEEATTLTEEDVKGLTEYRVLHDKYVIVFFHSMMFFMSGGELWMFHEGAGILGPAEQLSLSILIPKIVCNS